MAVKVTVASSHYYDIEVVRAEWGSAAVHVRQAKGSAEGEKDVIVLSPKNMAAFVRALAKALDEDERERVAAELMSEAA
jgi:hypothetical protein